MENRDATLIVGKGGSGSITTRVTVPKKWVDEMDVLYSKFLNISFDGKKIIIEKKELDMKMLKEFNFKFVNNISDNIINVDDFKGVEEFLNRINGYVENIKALSKVENDEHYGIDTVGGITRNDICYLMQKEDNYIEVASFLDVKKRGSWIYLKAIKK